MSAEEEMHRGAMRVLCELGSSGQQEKECFNMLQGNRGSS